MANKFSPDAFFGPISAPNSAESCLLNAEGSRDFKSPSLRQAFLNVGGSPWSALEIDALSAQSASLAAQSRERLLEDAAAVERAGAFALVLEGIPAELAREITERASIPTIGIGAGIECDGQVLVMHDVLGLSESFLPRFAKPYAHLWQEASAAATSYIREVRERAFPTPEHSYGTKRA